ncbi:MAG: hypothetical protein IJN63_05610, partial [Clostridia bacterium]|nr:hypothetical protein [Clostridia bacterium]
MKKLLCLSLVIITIASMLGACGGAPVGTDAVTTAPVSQAVTTDAPAPVTTEAPQETPTLSEDKYDGYEFRIITSGNLVSSKDANDFGGVEGDTELLELKKYIRKVTVEDQYDIMFNVNNVIKFGSSTGSGTGFKALQQSYIANSYDYDFAMIGTYDVAQAATNGFLANMADLPYIDLERSWWDQNAVEQMSFGENVFFATGDIGILDNMVTHCVMFNKALVAENKDINDPYEMVRNHTWTVDNFITEVQKFGSDLNGDDKMDQYDAYGLMVWNDAAYSMLGAAEVRVATMVDGLLELTLYNDKCVAVYDKYVPIIASQYCLNYSNLQDRDVERVRMFNENQVLYSYCSL